MILNLNTLYCSLINFTLNFKIILKRNNTMQICNVHICVTIIAKLIIILFNKAMSESEC